MFSRRKSFRAKVAGVSFGRSHIPNGRCLNTIRRRDNRSAAKTSRAVLIQQRADGAFGNIVVAFTEVVIADPPPGVDQVVRRPVLIVKCLPDQMIAVEWNGKANPQLSHRVRDICLLLFESKLRGMHAENNQTSAGVLVCPTLYVRQLAKAVNAGVRPEIGQDDLAAQALR